MRMILIRMELLREGTIVELLMLEQKARWGLAWTSIPKAVPMLILSTLQQPLALSRKFPAVSPLCYVLLETHIPQNSPYGFRLPVSSGSC